MRAVIPNETEAKLQNHRHHHHLKHTKTTNQLEINISLENKNQNSAARSGEEFKNHQLYPLQMEDKETGPQLGKVQ